MLSLEAFVVSHDSDEGDFDKATSLALTLDRADFVPDAYRVNSVEFPHVSKGQKSGSKDEEADEDALVHGDPGAMGSGPSSSSQTFSEEPNCDIEGAAPFDSESPGCSEAGLPFDHSRQFLSPRHLEVSDFESLDISNAQPASALVLGESSARPRQKRRKVASTRARSPLASGSTDNDRLRLLEQKLEEEAECRRQMEERMAQRDEEIIRLQAERDDHMKREQARRDEEMKMENEKRHSDMMLMLVKLMGKSPEIAPAHAAVGVASGSQSHGSPAASSPYSLEPANPSLPASPTPAVSPPIQSPSRAPSEGRGRDSLSG
jgi:hypothetical protein